MIINNVKFLGSRIVPNPVEVDYWIDTRSDPYGSVIRYYNGTDWIPLTTQGGFPEIDLSNYYTKGEINNLFNNFDAFDESLYYTKKQIDAKGYLTSIPTWYVTEDELNNKGFLTAHQDISHLAKKTDVYTKGEVDKKLADAVTGGTIDLSNYYTKQETYSKKEIDNKFGNIVIPDVDLSNYYNKSEVDSKIPDTSKFITADDIPTIPTSLSLFTNDTGYITLEEVPVTDLSEYAKLSDIPTDYYTKTEIDDKFDNIDIPEQAQVEEVVINKGDQPENADIWIDLSETSPVYPYIEDAPMDGKMYVRMNGQWVEFVYTPQEPEQPESPFMYYGYITDQITNMNQITFDMLNVNTVNSDVPQLLGKTSLGLVPQGAKIIVCIPSDKQYTAYKDNGMGTMVPFNENILGCNKLQIKLNDVSYDLYGEFLTVGGEMFIYIN